MRQYLSYRRKRLLASSLYRAAKPDSFAIFGDRAARQIEAALFQKIDQRIVRKHRNPQRLERSFRSSGRIRRHELLSGNVGLVAQAVNRGPSILSPQFAEEFARPFGVRASEFFALRLLLTRGTCVFCS